MVKKKGTAIRQKHAGEHILYLIYHILCTRECIFVHCNGMSVHCERDYGRVQCEKLCRIMSEDGRVCERQRSRQPC